MGVECTRAFSEHTDTILIKLRLCCGAFHLQQAHPPHPVLPIHSDCAVFETGVTSLR